MGGGAIVALFLFGVDGPASSPFELGTASMLGFFRFLLILANLGEVCSSVTGSSLVAGEDALRRADRLVDMLIGLECCDNDSKK